MTDEVTNIGEVSKAGEVSKDTNTAETAKKAKVRYVYSFNSKNHEDLTLEDIQRAKGALGAIDATRDIRNLMCVYELIHNINGKMVLREIKGEELEKLLKDYVRPPEREFYVE